MKPFPKADRGYIEVNVETWGDLYQYTNYFSDTQFFIFRGQGDSNWPLVTTLDRYLSKFHPDGADVYKVGSLYRIHLKHFKESLRGRGLKLDGMSDNELWALGQHYGLYTPLLDWTYSFYIALFLRSMVIVTNLRTGTGAFML